MCECTDGAHALKEARRFQPDAIIADVIMPGFDGFRLCRALQRDALLAEVPVILVSWKEDLLQRMRELKAGAKGYLRKESGASQVLAQVRNALRPRVRLELQLKAEATVRGRVDGIGMAPLLRAVASVRPDARVTVRDAWNLFEIDLREGRIVGVTRTASDGSFANGPDVLAFAVGITSARFTVSRSSFPVQGDLEGDLEPMLIAAAERLSALIDALSGRELNRVTRGV